jgi:hypothetical protein
MGVWLGGMYDGCVAGVEGCVFVMIVWGCWVFRAGCVLGWVRYRTYLKTVFKDEALNLKFSNVFQYENHVYVRDIVARVHKCGSHMFKFLHRT